MSKLEKYLYITEKPSQVLPLSKALSANNMKSNSDIEPLSGHILRFWRFAELDERLSVGSWVEQINDNRIPFYPKEIKKKIKEKQSYLKNGKKLWNDNQKKYDDIYKKILSCDKIVIATDPDNEGAALAVEIIEKANALNKVAGMINMSKLDLESLKKEVKILDKLPYLKMSEAADARAYYDQVFGINLTVAATAYLGKGSLLQVGGVKLPLILMIVQRDLEYETFKSIPYFTINGKAEYNGKLFDIEIINKNDNSKNRNRFSKEENAKDTIEKIKANTIFTVDDFKEVQKKEAPPKPYSLAKLQSECNVKFKLTASETLKYAQTLYDIEIESYPRTDSNYYSEGEYLLVNEVLRKLSVVEDFKTFISMIENTKTPMKRNIFDDSKIDAHTALAPTNGFEKEKWDKLDSKAADVFKLVVVRYIMQFMQDYEYLNVKLNATNTDDISLKTSENICKKMGWKSAIGNQNNLKVSSTIPNMSTGEKINILPESLTISKGKTKPRERFSEADAIEAMEKISRFFDDDIIKEQLGEKGIATPATRHIIIEELKTSKKGDEPYVKVEKGKLVSTSKARDLIKILPKDISSPLVRAEMESKLKDIMKGTLSKQDFMSECKNLVDDFIKRIAELGELPKVTPRQADIKTDELCPLCKKNYIVESTNVFRCESNKYEKGKQSGCKFMFMKNQKLIDAKFALTQFKRVLTGEVLTGRNGNKISLDLTSDFFTKIEFVQNDKELIETPKTFKLNGKFCFKNCYGKNLTKKQAEKLLNGEEVELKRKSKKNIDYSITVWLEDDGKFGSSFN